MNGEEAVIQAYEHAVKMVRDVHVKIEDHGDTIVVQASGVCESRLLYRQAGLSR
jgi:predicted ABC-type transport system involved in lysophospholipase L1 biosynthesis ATPase subunit